MTLAKQSAFSTSGLICNISFQSKLPPLHLIPCQNHARQNDDFVGLQFFGGKEEYPYIFPSMETPTSKNASICKLNI